MTRLFIRFYLGVLAVLFLAWYIHGIVLERRSQADYARVVEQAHGGGARMVARELQASVGQRDEVLERLRERFDYPVEVARVAELPSSARRRLSRVNDVLFFQPEAGRGVVVALLPGGDDVVRLGPFPDYDLREIEVSLAGWVRLTTSKLAATSTAARPDVLRQLRQAFDFPVEITSATDLPAKSRRRLAAETDVVFYSPGSNRWFAAAALPDGQVVRFGPFPNFERIEQKAATTTLALVLLPAALAIALLLRPVARQLRHVEHAAKVIASGDLTARVDQRRVGSARSLAQAFNDMANRTETLVRTQRELLQAVSHELRTPLSRMRFAIDLIETAKDDAQRKQRLESLDDAAEELDELVGELLRYVRTETTEPLTNPEAVALLEMLETLIPQYQALHSDVAFQVGDVPAAACTVTADRFGFQRALRNLLSNAGRFARSRVAIRSFPQDGRVAIDVDDDGEGIPEADRQRVLEPFVRLDNRVNGEARGVGLGLALVKRIVTQHGGTVKVTASPLGGCRVRTTWPGECTSEAHAT